MDEVDYYIEQIILCKVEEDGAENVKEQKKHNKEVETQPSYRLRAQRLVPEELLMYEGRIYNIEINRIKGLYAVTRVKNDVFL